MYGLQKDRSSTQPIYLCHFPAKLKSKFAYPFFFAHPIPSSIRIFSNNRVPSNALCSIKIMLNSLSLSLSLFLHRADKTFIEFYEFIKIKVEGVEYENIVTIGTGVV